MAGMSEPDEDRPDSSQAPAERAPARASGKPAAGRWTLVPSVMPFGDRTGPGNHGGNAESRQITIAELLLVMTIVAAVLSLRRMVPEGHIKADAFLWFMLGLIVLSMLRPRRAVTHVAVWVMVGFMTAQGALQPDWADVRVVASIFFLVYTVQSAFSRQCVAARRAWPLTARRLWLGFVGLCGALCVLALNVDSAGVHVSWWLPILLYALASGAGLWRALRPSHTRCSQ